MTSCPRKTGRCRHLLCLKLLSNQVCFSSYNLRPVPSLFNVSTCDNFRSVLSLFDYVAVTSLAEKGFVQVSKDPTLMAHQVHPLMLRLLRRLPQLRLDLQKRLQHQKSSQQNPVFL